MSVELKNMESPERAAQKLRGVAVFQLNSAAASVETIASALAPVDTGFMRAHIKQTETATDNSLRAVTESQADYSQFVEYGTVNSEAQPFMTPAFESAKKQLASLRNVF